MYFDVKPESVSRPQSGPGLWGFRVDSRMRWKMLNGMNLNGSLLQINGAHQLAAQHMLMDAQGQNGIVSRRISTDCKQGHIK